MTHFSRQQLKTSRFCCVVLIAAFTTFAGRQVVTSPVDSVAGSLRAALLKAQDGDSVVFNLPGGSETLVVASQIEIAKSITIDGSNVLGSKKIVTVKVPVTNSAALAKASLHVSTFRVLNITQGTVNIGNLTIKGGRVKTGGYNNHASGGAVQITGSDSTVVTMNKVTISESGAYDTVYQARSYGGGLFNGGVLTMDSCTVSGNRAVGSYFGVDVGSNAQTYGGGIYNSAVLTIAKSTISNNDIYGATYFDDDVRLCGGGICNYGVLNITGSTISNNTSNSSVEDGSVASEGGGIYNIGTMEIAFTTISNNTAQAWTALPISKSGIDGASGGGILNEGTMHMLRCTVLGNSAWALGQPGRSFGDFCEADGGGICNFRNSCIAFSTIANNVAGSHADNWARSQGGGIFEGAGLHIVNKQKSPQELVACTIVGNLSSAVCDSIYAFASGSGVQVVGDACLLNNIVMDNSDTTVKAYRGNSDACNINRRLGSTKAYYNFVGQIQRSDSLASDSGHWDASNRSAVANLDVFGTNTPLCANNGGPTFTIAIPANSFAAGTGVRVGVYVSNDTVHYDAFWNGAAWISVATGNPVSGVTELTTDQRGVAIADPQAVGAFYVKQSTATLMPSRIPAVAPAMIAKGKSIVISNPGGKNLVLRVLTIDGREVGCSVFRSDLVLNFSKYVAGVYFVRVDGFGSGFQTLKFMKD